MNAELAARITAAKAADADCTAEVDASIDGTGGPEPHWMELYFRICTEMRAVLGELAAIEQHRAGEAGKLDAIRGVLDAFDWETDDMQYALERIDEIAGQRP
jgi:hypothetical protein